jgi:hypothetical protein
MTAKTSPARRDAFFKALAETGNQTIAAERAKVSRAWVQLHRSTDPDFKERCVAALGEARARLRARAGAGRDGEGLAPPGGWAAQDGEELVVRGSNGRLAQVARARVRQWSPRAEARFLQTLARSCNVKRACAAVGLSVAGAYAHRKRWTAFARAWDEAVAIGGMRLEVALVERGGNLFSGSLDDDAVPLSDDAAALLPMGVDEALQLLRLYQHRLHGVGRPLRQARVRTLEEVRPEIERKVRAILARDAPAPKSAASAGTGAPPPG